MLFLRVSFGKLFTSTYFGKSKSIQKPYQSSILLNCKFHQNAFNIGTCYKQEPWKFPVSVTGKNKQLIPVVAHKLEVFCTTLIAKGYKTPFY